MIICICGKTGSGKSTLALKIKEKHPEAIYVDVDLIAHQVLNYDEVKSKIIELFGDNILENSQINRKKLGKIVFNNKEKMQLLMDITWKYMEKDIDDILMKNTGRIIILDYIFLPITKYFKESKIRILLDIPKEIREKRILKRDNISKEEFELRDNSCVLYKEHEFNHILKNNNDIMNLIKIV